MNRARAAGLLMGLMALAGAARTQVRDSSFAEPNGDRVLRQWIDIRGPADCVWKAFTDEAAIKASGMAMAHVDLRNGGVLEEGFTPDPKPGQTIRHEIITYIPGSLLVLRNQSTPPGLPHADLYPTIVQVISLEPRDAGVTRLTIAHTGYLAGPGYDALYAFFRGGNAGYLAAVKKVCEVHS